MSEQRKPSNRPRWQKAILGLLVLPFIALGFVACLIFAALVVGWEEASKFIVK